VLQNWQLAIVYHSKKASVFQNDTPISVSASACVIREESLRISADYLASWAGK
jgi:hypothetical protein